MYGFSSATVLGNLTRDVETKTITGGMQVGNFSIAVNRKYTSGSGEKKEEVSFFDIVIYGKLAGFAEQYLKKGDPVFVQGRLQQRSWTTDDGMKKSKVEVVADVVRFIGGKKDSGGVPNAVKGAFPGAHESPVDDGEIPF